jgi:DNA-binding transcriptional MerR regulator
MKGFNKKRVAEITGLSPRLVQFYTEEGVVIPEVDKGEGRGHARRYSRKNLYEFIIIRQLSEFGLTLETVRTLLQLVRMTFMGFESSAPVVTEGEVKKILSKDMWANKVEATPIMDMEHGGIFKYRDIYFIVEQDIEENKLMLRPRVVNKEEAGGETDIFCMDESQNIGSALILNLGKLYEKIIDV